MAANADHSAAELMLDLSAARQVWLSKTSLLLLLKSGQLVLAHLTLEAGTVKQIKVSSPLRTQFTYESLRPISSGDENLSRPRDVCSMCVRTAACITANYL